MEKKLRLLAVLAVLVLLLIAALIVVVFAVIKVGIPGQPCGGLIGIPCAGQYYCQYDTSLNVTDAFGRCISPINGS